MPLIINAVISDDTLCSLAGQVLRSHSSAQEGCEGGGRGAQDGVPPAEANVDFAAEFRDAVWREDARGDVVMSCAFCRSFLIDVGIFKG